MKSFGSLFALLALGVGSIGCATGEVDQPIGWQEFKARAVQEPETGTYIYDGDQTAMDEGELYDAYQSYRAQFDDGTGIGVSEAPLIVNVYNGQRDKWASPLTITYCISKKSTYCISKKSFGSNYNAVVAAVEGAIGAWKATGAGVNYTHVVAEDANCTNRNNNVTFNVRQDRSTQYYAKAFFPYYPRSYREVVISSISYNPANLGPWTLKGILTHELGHSLGFRHEHIRPENLNRASTCSTEDTNWDPLTDYDSASVMHYPHNGCAGTNTGDLAITTLDAQGARALYP
jgi:serralysin